MRSNGAARRRSSLGSRLLDRLQAALLAPLFGLLHRLPEERALAFGERMGEILCRRLRKRRRVAEVNLRLAFPESSEEAREAILVRSCRNLARIAVETIRLPSLTDEEVRARVGLEEGARAVIERARARERGLIFVTGHIGNWELAALGLAMHGIPLHIVARPLNNPHIDARLEGLRARGGNVVVSPDDGPAGVRTILAHLRRGGMVGILADQCPQRHRGIPVPFFGKLAWSHRGPALLAIRSGAAVVPGFIHGVPGGRTHSIRIDEEIPVLRTGDGEEDIRALTTRIQAAIEAEVRRAPEDWFWIHRRWKRSPDAGCIYPAVHRHRRRKGPAAAGTALDPAARRP
jgi:KDO2-lipid IV(A) lauroyltransferase